MRIAYVAVPADALPEGVYALVVEGEHDVVFQMNEDATVQELGEALTECIGAHVERSWVHVRSAADWESLKLA
jgi:hypothetical protein